MRDETWPVATPRDEMLARVAARGTRIRAVRGAINALAILSVVGASAFGVNAAVDGLTRDAGTEVENIAMVPEPPDVEAGDGSGADDGPSSTEATPGTTDEGSSDGTPGTGTPSSGSGTTGAPGTTATTGGAGTPGTTARPGSGGRGPSTTAGTTTPRRPSSTTTAPAGSSTTAPPTTVAPPEVSNLRMRVDGDVFMGLNVCKDDPSSVLAVEIRDAERAVMSWNRAGETRSQEMTRGEAEWSAPLNEIDDQAADVPVFVTIEATGPGGTTRRSVEIHVADCSPPPSDPPAPGA